MKRVLVIGSGGAGKSTFARRLSERLKLELIHLDQRYWRPGWVESPKTEWEQTVAELVKRDAWVMDGNYSGTLDARLAACDTVIFLDLPRRVCLWRIVKRRALHRGRSRPDMAPGCPEQLSLEFILWVWNYNRRSRPKVLALLEEHARGKRVLWLRSTAEVERFLNDAPHDGETAT